MSDQPKLILITCRLDDNVTNKQLEVKTKTWCNASKPEALPTVFARNCIIRLSFVIQLSRAKPANNQFTGKTLKFWFKLVSDSCVESLIRDFAYHEVNFTIWFKFSICYVVRTEIPCQISADSNFIRSSLSSLSSWFSMHKLIATSLSPSAKAAKIAFSSISLFSFVCICSNDFLPLRFQPLISLFMETRENWKNSLR